MVCLQSTHLFDGRWLDEGQSKGDVFRPPGGGGLGGIGFIVLCRKDALVLLYISQRTLHHERDELGQLGLCDLLQTRRISIGEEKRQIGGGVFLLLTILRLLLLFRRGSLHGSSCAFDSRRMATAWDELGARDRERGTWCPLNNLILCLCCGEESEKIKNKKLNHCY